MIQNSPIPIIAVRDVKKTAQLLEFIFQWKNKHPGTEFAILVDVRKRPCLMLHDFDAHEHKRFSSLHKSKGIGQSLYVFVNDYKKTLGRVQKKGLKIVEKSFRNENSQAAEFTFKINEGYQFSVCDTDSWVFYCEE